MDNHQTATFLRYVVFEKDGIMDGSYEYTQKKKPSWFALISFTIAVIAAVIFTASGFGYHWKIWGLGTGFRMLTWGTYISMFGVLVTLISLIITRPGSKRGGFGFSLIGFLLSLTVTGTALFFYHRATSAPAIHDITTDTTNPPQFKAVLPLRKNAPNGSAYGGPKVAELQHKYYPDIRPVILSVAPGIAYHRCLDAAHGMNWWKIQAADSLEGRIEATSTIPWFGFKDDIVVRIDTTQSGGSRIDIRSMSRLGGSDIGENARRVRSYIAKIEQQQ